MDRPIEWMTHWLETWGVTGWLSIVTAWSAAVLGLALVAVIAFLVSNGIFLRIMVAFVRRTKTRWDDALVDRRLFRRLAHLGPALVISASAPLLPPIDGLLQRVSIVYFLIIGLLAMLSFIDAGQDIYQSYPISKHRPIKGVSGLIKLLLIIFATLLGLAVILDRSPWLLISGLGAMTAVLLLVFKDTLLGLVAGVQLTVNDMVAIGDWIEMPKYGADGDVIDISLHTVKVQNWDKTITTIPSYALVSDSFKNWRGMTASGGRRIKRAIHMDVTSFAFCSDGQLDRLEQLDLIREYVKNKRKEIADHNDNHVQTKGAAGNGRAMTNIGTFRAYIEAYLRAHPAIHKEMTLMVRQLEPTATGLPLEIYTFTNTSAWLQYEAIQADIFDHVMTVAPLFNLRVFQQPSGHDFGRLSNKDHLPHN